MTDREIEAQAAEWMTRLDASGYSVDIVAHFDAWRRADLRHHIAFRRVWVTWEEMAKLAALKPISATVDASILAAPRRRSRRGTSRTPWFIPAFRQVVITLLAGLISLIPRPAQQVDDAYRYYENHTETSITISLEGGTQATLEVHTRIRVRSDETRQTVDLEKGTSTFKVATEDGRSFKVEAGGARVSASGSEFSISVLGPSSILVRVKQGEARISKRGADIEPTATSEPSWSQPIIKAGFEAFVDNDTIAIQSIAPKAASADVPREKKMLVFYGEPLAEVVAQINEFNAVELVIENPAIAGEPIGATIDPTDLQSVLASLESLKSLNVRFERRRDGSIAIK